MSRIKITEYEFSPEWNSMTIEQRWSTWEVSSHSDGDVEISCTENSTNDTEHLILNQDELKQFIAFLQTKVRQ